MGPPVSASVPGAENLARSLAIDLARQRVLAETATSKTQQQRLDQAFSAIKDFEHAHGPVTPLRDIRGSSNDLDKISVAANFRRNSSAKSLAESGHALIPESPTGSLTGSFTGKVAHAHLAWHHHFTGHDSQYPALAKGYDPKHFSQQDMCPRRLYPKERTEKITALGETVREAHRLTQASLWPLF